MFSRFVRTNDWFVMVDCFGGRRYRVEYKYIIPCWIGVVLGMVGLICGEVWGFGERESGHLVSRRNGPSGTEVCLKTISPGEGVYIFHYGH